MNKLKILVCGGRHFSDYALLEKTINGVIAESGREDIEIVSGHCIGADRLGELYAEKHNAQAKIFPAEWEDLQSVSDYPRHKKCSYSADYM